jgi:hypothetical protein
VLLGLRLQQQHDSSVQGTGSAPAAASGPHSCVQSNATGQQEPA